jgi:DNA-binding NtrC family response regulator
MARVLVIEDNRDLRDLMQVILEHAGYDVELAADGQIGMKAQRERPADIVVTDIFMPNQDGIETIAKFREEYPGLKVIVMSGDGKLASRYAHLAAARELGVRAMLPKPFDEDELLNTIRGALA